MPQLCRGIKMHYLLRFLLLIWQMHLLAYMKRIAALAVAWVPVTAAALVPVTAAALAVATAAALVPMTAAALEKMLLAN